ncbi:MAG TPA: FliI/YscN family ATPase [Myxococcota bacterium]|nr:FliI/YscN family ATPase [Myxococcota bacterium]
MLEILKEPDLSARLSVLRAKVRGANPCLRSGRLEGLVGSILTASLPGARVGERVLIGSRQAAADVCGFRGKLAMLLPAGECGKLSEGSVVRATGSEFRLAWSEKLLGRVLDARGRPLDGRPAPEAECYIAPDFPAPAPLTRKPIGAALECGIRAIDGINTLAQGQRLGLFARPGLGKSTLLGQVARGARADCIVLALVGERGRELPEFIANDLGEEGLRRSVIVCATSDRTAAERALALPVATAIAHGFRSRGRSVLLLADSLTRHARALREIALAAGEPPGRRGYPPSVFDGLAKLIERSGNDSRGSMTAIYTVLMDADADDDPLAIEVKGLLDGHIVLDRDLAGQGCFPAVDPVASLSRLMDKVVGSEHLVLARQLRLLWSSYEQRRDLIAAGVYEPGSEPLTDKAIEKRPLIIEWLRQAPGERCTLQDSLLSLKSIIGDVCEV